MPDNRLPYVGDLVSWLGIAWIVAFLAGLWGAMIGIGRFGISEFIFLLCGAIVFLKVLYETLKDRSFRRAIVCAVCSIIVVTVELGGVRWTDNLATEATEQQRRLAQLDQIPDLQKRVGEIPALQKQIADLQQSNRESAGALSTKEVTIEGLANTVISQQKTIAANAHKDMLQVKSDLSGQILHYQTDETNAVSRVMRPARTLGNQRANFVDALRSDGPHQIAITPAHGSREALDFSQEIESAFRDAGWTIVPTEKLALIVKDGVGLRLVIKKVDLPNGADVPASDLTPTQLDVAAAFLQIGLKLDSNPMENGDKGVTELYVGLQ